MKDISKNTLTAIVAGVVGVVLIAGMIAGVSTYRYETDAKINAQSQVEKTKIERENQVISQEISAKAQVEQTKILQEAESQRTKERMNAIPWYKGGENKTAVAK